jgi:hypothetical protein
MYQVLQKKRLLINLLKPAYIFGHGLDIHQILLHFIPAVPESIVGVGVESTLEVPHAVNFQSTSPPYAENHRCPKL